MSKPRDTIPKICLECKFIFYRKDNENSSNWKRRKFCCYDCSYKYKRNKKRICEFCLKNVWMRHWKQRFCSRNCMYKWRELLYKKGKIKRVKLKPNFGKDNVNWRGGVTVLNEKIRKHIKYKLWRDKVFKRDNYTCQSCGKRGGNLEAHHIKEFSIIIQKYVVKTIKDALDCEELWLLENGQTLCIKCHQKTFKFFKNQYVKN